MTLRTALLPLASFISLVACGGPSFDSLCERYVDECGEADQTLNECKAFASLATSSAEKAGCEAELDAYLECVDGSANLCDDDVVSQECGELNDALEKCAEPQGQDDPPAG